MKRNKNKEGFNKIVQNIKEIKIQGARNIAKSALRAYSLVPTESSRKILLNSRPTEPMMRNILNAVVSGKSSNQLSKHFEEAQGKIDVSVLKFIKNNDRIFTHCHSTNVVNALIYAKKHKKKFEVYVTETRPLFQGRKTARELKKTGIKVTMFIDSASAISIEKENRRDKIYVNKVFLGADALLKDGIINKIGSGMISQIAYMNKIPVYVIADSWKFTKNKVPIEQRKLNEIWDNAPKNIRLKNPAFEFVPKKYISGIVSELGFMMYSKFVESMEKK